MKVTTIVCHSGRWLIVKPWAIRFIASLCYTLSCYPPPHRNQEGPFWGGHEVFQEVCHWQQHQKVRDVCSEAADQLWRKFTGKFTGTLYLIVYFVKKCLYTYNYGCLQLSCINQSHAVVFGIVTFPWCTWYTYNSSYLCWRFVLNNYFLLTYIIMC